MLKSRFALSIAIALGLTMFAGGVESKSVDERLEELIWYYDSEDAKPNTIIRLADEVIELEEECEAFWRRGWAYNQLENWEAAANDFYKSIRKACSNDSWTWYQMGIALYFIDGREKESIRAYSEAIKRYKDDDSSIGLIGNFHYGRALAHIYLGNTRLGCSDFKTALDSGLKDLDNLRDSCKDVALLEAKNDLQTNITKASRDECINAADYKGCMEYHSGPSTESGSEPGTVNVAQPDPYNYDPDSVMQLKIRGSYGRYLTFIGKTVNTYTGTSGYMTPGSPGSVSCTTSPGFGAYSSSYTTCRRSGYVAPTYVPGTPGGVQNRKYRYELDCQDMTFDRKGDYAGGVANKGWMSVDNDPTAQAVANKYCSRIHSLPRAVSR
tara:strand:+ start:542 stop:1687 length:1146 start_codon:yes stop_codon:yes gene_type:complete